MEEDEDCARCARCIARSDEFAYLGPVRRDPLRGAVLLGAGLLVCGALRGAEGVREIQDAPIRQPLSALDLPPPNSTPAAAGALQ